MNRYLERILIAIFFVGAIALFVKTSIDRPRVFILHSYDQDYSWTHDVTVGLKRVLDPRKDYSVRWHYMDLKRYPWPDYKAGAGLRARNAIDRFEPQILIAVDDDAQEYAAKYYADHPTIKIVFAGINGSIEPYGYDKAKNTTGILERKHFPALKQALQDLQKSLAPSSSPLRVLLIGDTSSSVKSDIEILSAMNWMPIKLVGTKLAATWSDWQDIIRTAPQIADVIVTTNYRKIVRAAGEKNLVPAGEIVRWTEHNSSIPLIGTNGFYVEDGGMMAIGTSGYEQGEVAGTIAQSLIDKQAAPSSIPVSSTSQFVVYLNADKLKERKLQLPPIYESFARATDNYITHQ